MAETESAVDLDPEPDQVLRVALLIAVMTVIIALGITAGVILLVVLL